MMLSLSGENLLAIPECFSHADNDLPRRARRMICWWAVLLAQILHIATRPSNFLILELWISRQLTLEILCA